MASSPFLKNLNDIVKDYNHSLDQCSDFYWAGASYRKQVSYGKQLNTIDVYKDVT